MSATLHKKLSIPPYREPWRYIRELAGRIGRRPYYDGRGRLTLRSVRAGHPVYTYTDRELLSVPELSADFTELRNAVVIRGESATGREHDAPIIRQTLAPGNPLSPRSMDRNGVKRYAVEIVDTDFRRRQRLQVEAKNELDGFNDLIVDISFDAMPVPHLEEWDPVRVRVSGEGYEVNDRFLLRSYRLPLTAQPAQMGSFRRYQPLTKKKRRTVKG